MLELLEKLGVPPAIAAGIAIGIAFLGAAIPGLVYLIRRRVENARAVQDLAVIEKTLSIHKEFKAANLAAELLVQKTLENALGPRIHNYVQFKQEENISRIVSEAQQHAAPTADASKIDEDWFFKFFNLAREVSNASMQELWARILAGEVNSPGTFSARTLETARDLSPHDARLFEKCCQFVFNSTFVILFTDDVQLDSFGFTFGEILALEDAGLIRTAAVQWTATPIRDRFVPIIYAGFPLILEPKEGQAIRPIKFTVLKLTLAGSELSRLIPHKAHSRYLEAFKQRFAQYEIQWLGDAPDDHPAGKTVG